MSTDIRKLMTLGQQHSAQRAWGPAAQTFQKVLNANPKHYPAWNLLGKALNNLGRLQHSAQAFRRAIQVKPDVAEFHNNLGHVLRYTGELDQAIACFKQAIRLDPGYAVAYHSLGSLHRQRGNMEAAAPLLLEAVRCSPENSRFHTTLAMTLHQLKQYDKAKRHYEKAIHLDKRNARAFSNFGFLQEEQDELEAAERTYRHALALDPGDGNAMNRLGRILLEDKRFNNLLSISDQFFRFDPGNAEVLALRVAAHIGNGGREPELTELMDFSRFLSQYQVATFGELGSLPALNQALVQHILSHSNFGNVATPHGDQRVELLVEPKGPVRILEREIIHAVEQYMQSLEKDHHPFVVGLPKKWRLTAWPVVTEALSTDTPDIHPGAWLSGIYYVRLPTLIQTSQETAGWMEFGRMPKDLVDREGYATKLVQPVEGQMVLFPSYFYHETRAFESDLERIAVAFDVIPESVPP